MSFKARTVLVAAGLALGLVMVAPAQSRACEFLRRLFCWCHRPEPVVVEPIVEPRFYLGDDCRTEAYYPSYNCATQVELGTEPAPAPPAEDSYLESPPETTFQDEAEQSSRKPAEDGDTQGEQQPDSGTDAAPADASPQSPQAAADGNAAGTTRVVWQPISRATARKLLSRPTPGSSLSRSDRSRQRYTDPGWVPVQNAPAKGLAAK